jgi:hypothetical protein
MAVRAALIIALSLHLLAGVFWAGTTFVLARTGGAGSEPLFRPQMGAAVVAVLAGGYLWSQLHPTNFGPPEIVLTLGALCAVAAAGVQGAVGGAAIRALDTGKLGEAEARARIAMAQRIASVLLAVTIICMAAARYV